MERLFLHVLPYVPRNNSWRKNPPLLKVIFVVSIKWALSFKPFITSITRKCYSFMFCHMSLVIAFNGKPLCTWTTPVTVVPNVCLIMKTKSGSTAVRFITLWTMIPSRHGVEHWINIIVTFPQTLLLWSWFPWILKVHTTQVEQFKQVLLVSVWNMLMVQTKQLTNISLSLHTQNKTSLFSILCIKGIYVWQDNKELHVVNDLTVLVNSE